MATLYNMDPFAALKIIYQGATDGFAAEDFVVNERERGITLPTVLKRFLLDYGYMTVNRISDSVRWLHPNIMSERVFRYGSNDELPLMLIGRLQDYQVAISDTSADDPTIFLLKTAPEETQILPSDDTLIEIFKVQTCSVLMNYEDSITADEPELAARLLRENMVNLDLIANNPKLRREYSLNFSEEMRTFVVAEYIEGELSRFFFIRNEQFLSGINS